MSEAAIQMDVEAYVQITDAYIEGRLLLAGDDGLELARKEYNKAILERHLMRLVGMWDVRRGETRGMLSSKDEPQIIDGVQKAYLAAGGEPVERSLLKASVISLHYGMKEDDPLTHILFHDGKTGEQDHILPEEVRPLDTKVFMFYDPETEVSETDDKLVKLIDAFKVWARQQADKAELPSPLKARNHSKDPCASPPPTPPPKKRRTLKIETTLG